MAAYVGRGEHENLRSRASSRAVQANPTAVRRGEAESQGRQTEVHVRGRHD